MLEARNLDEVLKAFSCVNCGSYYNVELVNDVIALLSWCQIAVSNI